jgi:enoyl-[acyl-carrier protein] reductase II
MGTRFVVTRECIAHQRYKEALLAAIDTGTLVAGRYQYPTRLLRNDVALRVRDEAPPAKSDNMAFWEEHLGLFAIRGPLLEGDLEAGPAYAGSGVGLVSEIVDAGTVVRTFVEEADRILGALR